MTQPININVDTHVIPINIGGVKLEFETSEENILHMADLIDDKQDFLDKLTGDLAEEADRVSAQLNKEFSPAVFARYVEIEKQVMKRAYDMMFGEGTFVKLYAKYPDVQNLMNIFEVVGEQLGKALEPTLKARYAKQQARIKEVQKNVVSMKQNKRRGNRNRNGRRK